MSHPMLFAIAAYLGVAALICLIVAAVHAVQWLQELTERVHYLERLLEPQILAYELAALVAPNEDEHLVAGATITAGHDHSPTPRLYDQDEEAGAWHEIAEQRGVWVDLTTPEEEV